MALGNGLQFGAELVFTYGPLGFLEQPALYDSGLWMAAILYRAAIYAALANALLWAARRWLPLLPAAALVYGLLVIGYLEAAAVLLTFVVCAASLADGLPARSKYLVPVGGGILGAVEVLAKLNFGLTIVGLCLIALLGARQRRLTLPLFAGVFLSSLLFAWVLAGQSLANIPAFASNGLEVLSGYSQAMAANVSEVAWQRPYAVGAILLLVGAAAAAAVGRPRPRQLALVALAALFGFAMFKQGFVRQGLGSGSDYFPLMTAAALALCWQLPIRVRRLPPHTPAVLLLAPLAVLTVAALPRPSVREALKPEDHLEFFRQDLRALVSADERQRLRERGMASMTSTYQLDETTLALLRGRKVDVEPWEIGAAWAYDLEWQPLPVLQDYQAYTEGLDSLDVAALTSGDRPTAILRENTAAVSRGADSTVDDRLMAWDPPDAWREILCRYRAVRTTPRWQVLYSIGDRCGKERLLRATKSKTGAVIRVPSSPPASIVFARVRGLGVEGLETMRTFLYRARERWADLNGARSVRVVPGTLEDGLILRAANGTDFPAPFALAPGARTLSFRLADAQRPIEVSFYAQRVMPSSTNGR